MPIYRLLAGTFPVSTPPAPTQIQRIVMIRPCCIGDVIMATAALKALRGHYPHAHITWAVGGWSREAIQNHNLLDAILDTGPAANPARGPRGVWQVARSLRAGKFDLAVSLVRSPWMSAAVWLSGIPHRAGIDSLGRGFGYNIRSAVEPTHARHEAQIYLDVIAQLGADTDDCQVNIPVDEAGVTAIQPVLAQQGINGRYVLINPNGGSNPGMVMDAKRWPPNHFATLADALADQLDAAVIMVGGPDDAERMTQIHTMMRHDATIFAGSLSLPQIAALGRGSIGYIGNDTGLTHLIAGTGARTAMILGPSDPARYGPFAENTLTLWRRTSLHSGGVDAGTPADWDWARDGIGVDEVIEKVRVFLA